MPVRAYGDFAADLASTKDPSDASKQVIGGQFEAFGIVEREMLRYFGLNASSYLIDVGCGSGRLAIPMTQFLTGRYLGTDIVPDLVERARTACRRPDWRFEVVDALEIPEADGVADMVCAFSVFTHLLHEQTFVYFNEARRVLKPGGKIVFSFLEFAVPAHWAVFEGTVENLRAGRRAPLNMFMDRPGILAMADHLGLSVETFRDGSERFVPLPHPVTLESGETMENLANLGQSICVLVRA
jgi:SAM-dependent methyltransferase